MSKMNKSKSKTIETSVHLLCKAHFRYRTLDEARILAEYLAKACPNFVLSNVGLCELFINAIEHGNLQIKYAEKTRLQASINWVEEVERRLNLPENKNKYVDVYFNKTSSQIEIKVIDQGKGFDWKHYERLEELQTPKHLPRTRGKGIIIAKHLSFDSLTYSEKGNEVVAVILLDKKSDYTHKS